MTEDMRERAKEAAQKLRGMLAAGGCMTFPDDYRRQWSDRIISDELEGFANVILNAEAVRLESIAKLLRTCRNPNHYCTDGSPEPHQIGPTCMTGQWNTIVESEKVALEKHVWSLIELLARGNTEMSVLESRAEGLLEQRAQLSQLADYKIYQHPNLATLLTNICQILDVVKGEWGEAWSDWDQQQRDAASAWLKEYYERQAALSSAGTSGTFDGNDAFLVGSRGDQAREAFQAQLNHRGDSLSGKGEATQNFVATNGSADADRGLGSASASSALPSAANLSAPDRAEELARKILKMLISTEASRSKINVDRVASLLRREMGRSSGQEGRDGK